MGGVRKGDRVGSDSYDLTSVVIFLFALISKARAVGGSESDCETQSD